MFSLFFASRLRSRHVSIHRCLAVCVGLVLLAALPPQVRAQESVSRRSPVVIAVESVTPAVVSITTEQLVSASPFGYRSLLQGFLEGMEPRQQLQRASLGSGVIIDARGHILTNEHVIRGASRVTAVLSDEREIDCEVIGSDPDNDLAVLRLLDAKNVRPARMGVSSDLLIGETVIAIGNPYGLSQTVTTGVVSAVNRSFKADDRVYRNFIQTDAAINPGNSGGPLLNIRGELIGINTAIFGNAQGLGFAIPVDKARRVVEDLITFGQRQPGWLGLEVEEISGVGAGGRPSAGLVVSGVMRGSPAERAGVRVGDHIVSFDKARTRELDDYLAVLRQLGAGDTLSITLERSGNATPLTLVLRSDPFPESVLEQLIEQRLGIQLAPIDAPAARQYQLPSTEGLLITGVSKGGIIARIGGRPGDIIRKVNGVVTNDEAALMAALARSWGRRSATFLLQRGRIVYTVPVEF